MESPFSLSQQQSATTSSSSSPPKPNQRNNNDDGTATEAAAAEASERGGSGKKKRPAVAPEEEEEGRERRQQQQQDGEEEPAAKRRRELQRRRRLRRGAAAPPVRLAWPGRIVGGAAVAGGAAAAAGAGIPGGEDAAGRKRLGGAAARPNGGGNKRTRRVTIQEEPAVAGGGGGGGVPCCPSSSTSALWIDAYAPRCSKDVCVAPKKMKDIVNFLNPPPPLQQKSQQQQQQQQLALDGSDGCGGGGGGAPANARLLIVVGGPGIGKSTAIRLLAEEHGFEIREWSESVYSYSREKSWSPTESLEQASPMASFASFLQQAGAGYSSLPMRQRQQRQRIHAAKPANDDDANLNAAESRHRRRKPLILLEELPNRHGEEAVRSFRDLMTRHVRDSSGVPTVLVFSDVREGHHRPEQLEELVDRSVLYSEWVTILQIHSPTKARFKRCIQNVLQKQQLEGGRSSNSRKQPPAPSAEFFDDLYTRSGGDLRFAITTLQVERTQLPSTAATTTANRGGSTKNANIRDERLTTFHALGKLLYAKRRKRDERELSPVAGNDEADDRRGPLEFDPERVLEQSDLDMGGALSFLEYHSVDFFTDVTELSRALESFSDATFMLDRPRELSSSGGGGSRSRNQSSSSSSAFPEGYAGSLAGRTVACFNRHPVPGKFRQLSAPKIFEVMRKRAANHDTLRYVHTNLSLNAAAAVGGDGDAAGNVSMSCYLGATSQFATDCLPFVRTILSCRGDGGGDDSTSSSLDLLHSHVRATMIEENRKRNRGGGALTEEETAVIFQEQTELLREDDIGDFDSSDTDGDARNSNNSNNNAKAAAKSSDHSDSKEPVGAVLPSESPISTVASPP